MDLDANLVRSFVPRLCVVLGKSGELPVYGEVAYIVYKGNHALFTHKTSLQEARQQLYAVHVLIGVGTYGDAANVVVAGVAFKGKVRDPYVSKNLLVFSSHEVGVRSEPHLGFLTPVQMKCVQVRVCKVCIEAVNGVLGAV